MFTMQRVFSEAYADALAKQMLRCVFKRSSVQTDYAAGSAAAAEQTSFRTSSEHVGGHIFESAVGYNLDAYTRSAAEFLGVPGFEAEQSHWNVIKYEEGEQFKLHTDCWDHVRGTGSNQRVMTALIVLQQANEGGETVMPNLGMSVRPPPGFMLVWGNTENGVCSNMMLHGGMPPVNGTKLVMTKWFRGLDNEK